MGSLPFRPALQKYLQGIRHAHGHCRPILSCFYTTEAQALRRAHAPRTPAHHEVITMAIFPDESGGLLRPASHDCGPAGFSERWPIPFTSPVFHHLRTLSIYGPSSRRQSCFIYRILKPSEGNEQQLGRNRRPCEPKKARLPIFCRRRPSKVLPTHHHVLLLAVDCARPMMMIRVGVENASQSHHKKQ